MKLKNIIIFMFLFIISCITVSAAGLVADDYSITDDQPVTCSTAPGIITQGAAHYAFFWFKNNEIYTVDGKAFYGPDGSTEAPPRSTLPASLTNPGDVINCVLYREVGYEGKYEKVGVSLDSYINVEGSVVGDVSITPLGPKTDDDVTCTLAGITQGAAHYNLYWHKKGESLGSPGGSVTALPTFVLDSSRTSKKEVWVCDAYRVVDYDNHEEFIDRKEVLIENSPPTQPTVTVSPSPFATTDDKLTCSADGSTDADGDTIIYVYKWTSNEGDEIYDDEVDPTDTEPGETWECRATPWDGEDYGTHGYASTVINTLPVAVISSPLDGAVFNQADTITFDGRNSYDADGIITSYVWKDGSVQIGTSSYFTKAADTLTPGQHTITLEVTDNLGAKATKSIIITVGENVAPVAVISSPNDGAVFDQTATITFDGRNSYDPDGSITSYVWTSNIDGQIGTSSYFTKAANTLTPGQHTITLEVTDNDGAKHSTSVIITIGENVAPVARISSPQNGAVFDQTDAIIFDGRASDDPDGTITSYIWRSDVDGQIGTSSYFTKNANELTPVPHIITLEVTDNSNAKDTDSVTITILPNKAPEVNIKLPTNGSKFREGDEVKFSASARDPDGIIQGIVWESDKDGVLRTATPNVQSLDDTFSLDTLSVNTHIITIKATDDDGAVATSLPVTITVTQLEAPRASIYSPSENSLYKIGDSIIFSGAGDDYLDQGIIKKITWSIDGQEVRVVNTNANEVWDSFKLSNVLEGQHTVTLEVEDDSGLTDTDSKSFAVWDPAKIPAANIVKPETQSDYKYGTDNLGNFVDDEINFAGVGIPAQDGAHIIKYIWYSNLMNIPLYEGTSPTFSKFASDVPFGVHEITLVVEDEIGRRSLPSMPVTITVKDARAPTVWIVSPVNKDVFKKDVCGTGMSDTIHFIGDGEDTDGEIVLWQWFSNHDGPIGNEKEFDLSADYLSLGSHYITLIGTDNDVLQFTDKFEIEIILVECGAPDVKIISPENGSKFEFGDDILFNGTAVDPDGGEIETWAWYDVGFGELKSGTGDPESFILNNLTEGYHEIRFQAVDDEASSSYDTVWIYVGKVFHPPVANANGNYTGIVDQTAIPFTSIGSYDEDGFIVKFEWDFTNDGTYDAEGADVTHVYTELGNFTAKLCVTDNDGLIGCDTAEVEIVEEQILEPVAIADGPYSGIVNQNITLIGNKSYDPDPNGKIVKYKFDFGDGIIYEETETNAPDGVFDGNTVHKYKIVGDYTFTLTVTNDKGLEDDATSPVEVKKDENYPTAVMEITGNRIVGETLTFDGTGSIGDIVLYAWEIDDVPYMNGAVVEKIFDEAGTYVVKLVVVNSLGYGDSTTETVVIKEAEEVIGPKKKASIQVSRIVIPNDGYLSLGDTAEFIIKVENDGDYDLEDVKIAATLIDFGIRGTTANFELDEDDSAVKKIVLEMPEYELEDYYILRISVRAKATNGEDLRRVLYREIMLV